MNIKLSNTLQYEAWEALNPEFAGRVMRSKKATDEDGIHLVTLIRTQGVEAASKHLREIENNIRTI